MNKFSLILLLLIVAITSQAQGYAFVRDNDLYANMRKEPNAKAESSTDHYPPNCIVSNPTDLVVIDINTGEKIEEFDEINPLQVAIHPNKLVLFTADFMFSYYRNKNKEVCRGVTLLRMKDFPKITSQEQKHILNIAQKIIDSRNTSESSEIEEGDYHFAKLFGKQLGINNFDYLEKMEQLYFNENSDAQKLYPFVLLNLPLDGDGNHEIGSYDLRRWAYDNRGEVKIR